MLDGSEFYVVLKLVSGEQVMAVLRQEDSDALLLEYPMCIRTVPIIEANRESVMAVPLCQFSDDRTFVIDKKNVMFCKKLHHVFIPHYRKIVAEHEKQTFIAKDSKREELYWDDQDEMTAEEALKRIEMLEALLEKEPEKKEDEYTYFVDGNESIH